jgi:nucleoside 2-deoxyribosyltransferase
MKVYVASSFRNDYQQIVVKRLRECGFEVYDFKNPGHGKPFHWSEIDPNWREWNHQEFAKSLQHPIVEKGFSSDFAAMLEADICVLVTPCGKSAHLEAGWMQGAGKPTIILLTDGEPELMYKVFERIAHSLDEVITIAKQIENQIYSINSKKDLVLDSAQVH